MKSPGSWVEEFGVAESQSEVWFGVGFFEGLCGVGFASERIQPTLNGEGDAVFVQRFQAGAGV